MPTPRSANGPAIQSSQGVLFPEQRFFSIRLGVSSAGGRNPRSLRRGLARLDCAAVAPFLRSASRRVDGLGWMQQEVCQRNDNFDPSLSSCKQTGCATGNGGAQSRMARQHKRSHVNLTGNSPILFAKLPWTGEYPASFLEDSPVSGWQGFLGTKVRPVAGSGGQFWNSCSQRTLTTQARQL